MSKTFTLTIDNTAVKAEPGWTILQAADAAGVYIPRLCGHKDLVPHGSCRVCTVLVNGRPQSACTTPATPGMVVDTATDELKEHRKRLIEMLFVEGNHFCMFCERSGGCELQALGYRFGMLSPRYPYQFPVREVDASHPDVMVDRNRCILCGRCVRASRDLDGRSAFQFVGRGPEKRIAFNAADGLGGTDIEAADRAVEVCPVGAILRKREGYRVPIGQRPYDRDPIGSDIEAKAAAAAGAGEED